MYAKKGTQIRIFYFKDEVTSSDRPRELQLVLFPECIERAYVFIIEVYLQNTNH